MAANPFESGAMNSVTVRVPASTSNLGSGFDTLGIAFKLHNWVTLQTRKIRGVRIISPIDESARPAATGMITEVATIFFRSAKTKSFGFDVSLSGDVPIARGLGSSVTLRLGVLAALNAISDAGLSERKILDIVTALEGHPDNAAPALLGGFVAAGMIGDSVRYVKVPVKTNLKFVTLIPKFEVSTKEARKLVPQNYSKADTVHSLNRSALVTAAFSRQDYESLFGLFDDRIHQPYRQQLIPQLSEVIKAGEKSGAIGGWLSGSGSSIICITLENEDRIAKAMQNKLPDSDIKILIADNKGLSVVDAIG